MIYEINGYKVTWNEDKNKSNFKKHGVTFNEAATVFSDENALYSFDETHSEDEDRFILLGKSEYSTILTVCHCYRNGETIIRIISARKATREEANDYAGR